LQFKDDGSITLF